ncbi:MAG: carbohydrate ABC transporter permease [Lachnospiraceae bacterium]|nr:carbohydrate ABC transporter permease [Lachnospiraceae bacterium]
MRIGSTKNIKKRKKIFRTIRSIILWFVAVVYVIPIVFTICNSFMSETEITSNYGRVFGSLAGKGGYVSNTVHLKFIPDFVSFKQYYTVLIASPDYLLKFWNSVILVVPIVVFQVVVALLAAYGFTRYRGRIREMIFFAYIILMLMPYQVTLVPNYLVSDKLGLLDTYSSIWLPGIFSPFGVFILTKSMRRIPSGIIEAARVDGAGEWRIFATITTPLIKGTIASVVILVFIDYWNMVEQPLIMLTDQDMHPLSVFLSKINEGEIGLAFAVATVYMIPTLLTFAYGEDYLVEGISYQGGLKG